MTIKIVKRLMLSFVIVLLASIAPSSAQQAKKVPAKASKGSAWTVHCTNPDKEFTCKLRQQVVLKKTRQLLLAITIQKSGKPSKPSMMIQLPHGLFLPAGVKMKIDDNQYKLSPIQTCDVKGCYVGLPLGADQVKALSKGSKLNVEFQNLSKKTIKVPLPLRGFAAAYKKL